MKNRKFLYVFLVVLALLISVCGSVYATEDTENPTETETVENYEFVGFDGNNYVLPPLPEKINDYTHYVIVKDSTGKIKLFGFNETLEVTRSVGSISLSFDGGSTGKLYSNEGDWLEYAEQGSYSVASGSTFIYSCPDLTQYGEELNNEETFFLSPQTVLPPIVEKIRLAVVLQEILGILPVVLLIIVGLIGLRKALKFLSTVLHRS